MKNIFRLISMLITAMLLVAMTVACGDVFLPSDSATYGDENVPEVLPPELPVQGEGQGRSDDTPPDSDLGDYMMPFSRYNETVIVTVGRFHNVGSEYYLAPGAGLHNNAYVDMLLNELNIQIEVIFNVPFEEYHETLLRHKAADTLPDTFWIPSTAEGMGLFNELAINNRLADLTDAFTYTVGGMSREFLDGWDYSQLFQYNMVDSKILRTPVIGELFDTPFLWIRQDWLDELELVMPRTIGELEEVALRFLEADLGGQGATGIIFSPDDMFNRHYGILPIFAAFGAYPNNWIGVGGSAEWGGVQPEIRDALILLRHWNEMGIVPDRLLGMSSDEVFNSFIEGQRGGIFFGPWDQPRTNWSEHGAASQNLNENIVWVPFLGPVNSDGQYAPLNELIFNGGQVVLASHPNPEAVVKAMNLIDEVRNWRNPDFDNLWLEYSVPLNNLGMNRPGFPFRPLFLPQERLEIAAAMMEYSASGVLEVPRFLEHHLDFTVGRALFTSEDITPEWWTLSDERRQEYLSDEEGIDLSIWQARFIGYWAYNVVGNMFIDAAIDGSYVEVMPAFIGETDTWATHGEQLMDLQYETFIGIISGELPIEAFDDFVIEWYVLGGERATREVNELLNS